MIVVKVGGSLYDHPHLGPGLRQYLDSLPEPVLVVPGGGPFAEAVRKLDHQLDEDAAHLLALHAMNLAGEFLRRLGVRSPIADAVSLGDQLPPSWDVTSDSIAAQGALVHKASRLILLKSIDIPPGTPWTEAAERGWVDRCFPTIIAGGAALRSEDSASRLTGRVEVVNFRKYLESIGSRG